MYCRLLASQGGVALNSGRRHAVLGRFSSYHGYTYNERPSKILRFFMCPLFEPGKKVTCARQGGACMVEVIFFAEENVRGHPQR